MGKKRKAGRTPIDGPSAEEHEYGRERKTRLNIQTYKDVADSEDEFHLNRDEILLEDSPARKRQRNLDEQEKSFGLSDEEVLALPEDESDDDLHSYGSEVSTGSGVEFTGGRDTDPHDIGSKAWKRPSKSTKRTIEDDFDARGWGRSKDAYYDADAIETEGDALEEETEALRLQQKQLESMRDADFGLDDFDGLDKAVQTRDIDDDDVIHVTLPEVEVSDSMPPGERLRLLKTWYPELQHLANEFVSLQSKLEQAQLDSTAAETAGERQQDGAAPLATLKWIALRTYLSALVLYFTLLTAGERGTDARGKARSAEELRKHPIMECLVRCRKTWKGLEEADESAFTAKNGAGATSDAANHITAAREEHTIGRKRDSEQKVGAPKNGKRKRKSKAQREAEKALADAEGRRRDRLSKLRAQLGSLSPLSDMNAESMPMQAESRPREGIDNSEFGEETALAEHEAAEKAKRKKSLRFYTAQIAQKANKHDSARRDAGGDTDIPYRERFRDRQTRLNEEAERRGRKGQGPDEDTLGQAPSDGEDAAVATEARHAADEDYYEQIAGKTRQKAADKAALKEVQQRAAGTPRSVVRQVEKVGPDGKRAISYAIEKNKGMAPSSGRKSVRNPRVKKRKTFEDKVKKLGSIRPRYKGGEGRGGYGGELTGIKSNLVKSIKL